MAPVRIFNVRYSPNLGDGLLSECLEAALHACGDATGCSSADLAGRTDYASPDHLRVMALNVLYRLPEPLRHGLVRPALARRSTKVWRPHYAREMLGTRAIVIGGGNLLSDVDLNFPTKLLSLMQEASARGLPVMIYGVGLTRGWSRRGKEMLTRAFSHPGLRGVYLRDEESRLAWDELLGPVSGVRACVVRDPALLASRVFRQQPLLADRPPVVGVGVMSPLALRYHGAGARQVRNLRAWYVHFIRELLARGARVLLFTNGALEDRGFLRTLTPELDQGPAAARLILGDFATPADFCAHVASCNVVVAHRLHALIAGFSYGARTVALSRDAKVLSFSASIADGVHPFDPAQGDPSACADLVESLWDTPIPAEVVNRTLDEAAAGIARLAGDLSGFTRGEASDGPFFRCEPADLATGSYILASQTTAPAQPAGSWERRHG